jgi:hypothetical protein
MEAFPFAGEIANILASYMKIDPEHRADIPGAQFIDQLWTKLQHACEHRDPGLLAGLDEFQKSPDRMTAEIENLLKFLMYHDEDMAREFQSILDEYHAAAAPGATVSISKGSATVVGPNAQVKQDTKIEIDNIDLSKYLES